MGSKGVFISIEGINGIGKSRVAKVIYDYYSESRVVKIHRFPTYDRKYGIIARKMLSLDEKDFNMHEFTIQCLLDMQETYENCIKKELDAGCMVIADRFIHTPIAFYSKYFDRFTVSVALVDIATKAMKIPYPDITFILRKSPTFIFDMNIDEKDNRDMIEKIFTRSDWQKINFSYSQMRRSKQRYGHIRDIDAHFSDYVVDQEIMQQLENFID